jgi:hypothetical protein
MTDEKIITIGFSTHRPETLSFAAQQMLQHEAILLEEPENPRFRQMLKGEMTIEDYLLVADFEFPEFGKRSCELFQALYRNGKQLIQVDPFMTLLNQVQDFFENGGKPRDIDPQTPMGLVYEAERNWSASLVSYYERCLIDPFDEVVELVKQFDREDAVRERLRDRMRADAIISITPSFNTIYVEAGTLHIYLYNQLAAKLPDGFQLHPLYLMAPIVFELSGRRQVRGPGEKLTLRYTYRPDYNKPLADLLAARSLIHSKIQTKEEILGPANEFPHAVDEVKTAAMVEHLSFNECKVLYKQIKTRTTKEARRLVRHYLCIQT